MNYEMIGQAMVSVGTIGGIILVIIAFIFIPMGMGKRKKYGLKKELQILKKREKISYKSELLIELLTNLPHYNRIIYGSFFKNNLIFIDGDGIKLFQISGKVGTYFGKQGDEELINITKKSSPPIVNPLINLKENKHKLENIVKDIPIELVIITDNNAIIKYEDTNVRTIKIVQIAGTFNMNSNKYSKEQIDDIYNQISKVIESGNN